MYFVLRKQALIIQVKTIIIFQYVHITSISRKIECISREVTSGAFL